MKRGRNATNLAESRPFAFDSRVDFQEENHAYFVDGRRVAVSVSEVVKRGFPDTFDPSAVIRKNLGVWRRRASSTYHGLVVDKTDEEAEAAVLAQWERGRNAGTALHKHAELWLNGQPGSGEVPRGARSTCCSAAGSC